MIHLKNQCFFFLLLKIKGLFESLWFSKEPLPEPSDLLHAGGTQANRPRIIMIHIASASGFHTVRLFLTIGSFTAEQLTHTRDTVHCLGYLVPLVSSK